MKYKKNMINKIEDKYFLNRQTYLILYVYFICILFISFDEIRNTLIYFFGNFFNNIEGMLISKIPIPLIFTILLSIPYWIFFIKKDREREIYIPKKIENTEIEDYAKIIRNYHLNKINEHFTKSLPNRPIFVVGESGSGKSTLIKDYVQQQENNKNNIIYHIEEITYGKDKNFSNLIEKNSNIIKFIIFDQFERVLRNINAINSIIALLQSCPENNRFVFIIKDDRFTETVKKFKIPVNNGEDIYFVENKKEDSKLLIDKMWRNYTNCENDDEILQFKKQNPIYVKFIDKLISDALSENKLTFIQWNIIHKFICSKKKDDRTEFLKEAIKYSNSRQSINYIIDEYMYNILNNNIDDPLIGKIILYSLSQYNIGNLSEIDFKNLTFENEIAIHNIAEKLVELKILIKPIDSFPDTTYAFSHDYYFKLSEDYCNRNMNSNILQNIKNYCFSRTPSNENNLNKYRIRFEKKSSIILINLCLVLMLCINMFAVLYKCFNYANEINKINYIILNINVCLSVNYVYKHAEFFMKMFSLHDWLHTLLYYLVSILGIVASSFSLIYTSYWAICLGAEVIFLGLFYISLNMKKMLPNYSKNYFTFHGWIFVVIGSCICALNGVVNYVINKLQVEQYSYLIMLPWLLIYLIYMIISNFSHINKNNILILRGNVSSEDHFNTR